MKKLYVSLCFILAAITAFAQTQWAPVGATWYYNVEPGGPDLLMVIESTGDTSILAKQCSILETYKIISVMDSSGSYHLDSLYCPKQYTYEDSGRVFLYNQDNNEFNMLYDFNATTGDEISVFDTTFDGFCPEAAMSNRFQYIIDSTKNIVIDGITLKKQFVSPTQNTDWLITTVEPSGPTGNFPVIERIGATKFLFGVFAGQVMESNIQDLRCYHDNLISYRFHWSDSIPCNYLPSGITDYSFQKNRIQVFPNPTSGQVTIITPQRSSIEIMNIEGQTILNTESIDNKTTVDISGLANGVYLIKARTANGVVVKKIIKE